MIGGNIKATIQISTITKNAIGEPVESWDDVQIIKGWLDYQSGDSGYTNYKAKIQESTHVFVADYVMLDRRVAPEKCRVVIKDDAYDILLIDDPMELHKQLEFYLKYTGGQ